MSSLTVIKFSTANGAAEGIGVLKALQTQGLIMVDDYAIVSWPEGSKKPETTQAVNTTGEGALGGAFWGLLFGLLFFIPVLGAAIGAASGALMGALTDVGISNDFIKNVRSQVTEGTSALFVLSDAVVIDKVVQGFRQLPPHELIASNLTAEQEAALKEAFS